jgi:L-fuculose-phosphate aldolase
MATDSRALRLAVIRTACDMNALGINRGNSGNVSARIDRGFLVTPSALPYAQTKPDDIVAVDHDGNAAGRRAPSSEWRFHRDIYAARPEVMAIVHAHSPFATTLACLDRGIPAFHYMIAVAGGTDIRCASYATFGTEELSDAALLALDGRRACLLAHHGMIAISDSLRSALALAVEVETLAEIYWRALQIAEPIILSSREMQCVIAKFADYTPDASANPRGEPEPSPRSRTR